MQVLSLVGVFLLKTKRKSSPDSIAPEQMLNIKKTETHNKSVDGSRCKNLLMNDLWKHSGSKDSSPHFCIDSNPGNDDKPKSTVCYQTGTGRLPFLIEEQWTGDCQSSKTKCNSCKLNRYQVLGTLYCICFKRILKDT